MTARHDRHRGHGVGWPAWGVLFVLLAGAWGCRAFQAPDAPTTSTPARPVWDAGELMRHLRFLNSPEVEGRGTGTPGYALAASYVDARMAEFRLQPAFGSSFRLLYFAPLNYPIAASLMAVGADTVVFYPGLDYLTDGRTGQGSWEGREVVFAPGAGHDVAGQAVVLTNRQAATPLLERLRAAGAGAAFVVGLFTPKRASRPVGALPILQVTPDALALMTGLATDEINTFLGAVEPRLYRMPRRLLVRAEADFQTQASAINIGGYVPGKHPVLLRELVIVCADLDAVGRMGRVRTLDYAHLGAGVAALLELARNYSYYNRFWTAPERSILFAIWSGGRTGNAGLQAYLNAPTWPLEQTRAVVYLGLDTPEVEAVRTALAPHGVPLYTVALPDSLQPRNDVAVLPDPALRRVPRARAVLGPQPNLQPLLDSTRTAAVALAEQAHTLLLREALGSALMTPAIPDTPYVQQ